jgi:hypothetical protein
MALQPRFCQGLSEKIPSKLYLLLYPPSTIFGQCILRRTFLSKTSNRFSSCHTTGPGVSSSCRSVTLSDVLGEMTADVFAGRRLDSSLYLQTHVVFRCHRSSKVHKFVYDFEILTAKSHTLSGVANRPISLYFISNRNHVLCLLFVGIQPNFAVSTSSAR